MFYFEGNIVRVLRFQEILFLSTQKISIQMSQYVITFEGENLKILSFYEEETFIEGTFKRILIT